MCVATCRRTGKAASEGADTGAISLKKKEKIWMDALNPVLLYTLTILSCAGNAVRRRMLR